MCNVDVGILLLILTINTTWNFKVTSHPKCYNNWIFIKQRILKYCLVLFLSRLRENTLIKVLSHAVPS